MRQFIILYGDHKMPLSLNGISINGVLFTKEEAELRLNSLSGDNLVEVLEISSRPVEIVTNKMSIV